MSIATLALLLAVAGCYSSAMYEHEEIHRRVATPTLPMGTMEGRATLGMPIAVPESPWVLVPFALEREQRAFESDASYGASHGGYAAYAGQPTQGLRRGLFHPVPKSVVWHNAMFANIRTGETRLLLQGRTPIVGYWMPLLFDPAEEGEEPRRITPPFVLFEIVTDDTDGDDLLTPRDAKRAFVANPDGTALRPLTPRNRNVSGYWYRGDQAVLMLAVVEDLDDDDEYTAGDQLTWYRYRIGDPGPAEPLIDSQAIEKAESILR